MKPINRSLKDGECASGSVNFITREGETVLRPMGHWSKSIHNLLEFLEGVGFVYAPRFLGVDTEKQLERLSYIHGEVELRPWTDVMLGFSGLAQIAEMLKSYHEKVSAFTSEDARWHLDDREQNSNMIIRHGDIGPWNMVWEGGRLVGLIDWDFAEPGTKLEDVAQVAWHCIPLKPARQSLQAGVKPEEQKERFKYFCDACGVATEDVLEALKMVQDLEIERMQTHGGAGIEPWASFLKRGDVKFVKEDMAWLQDEFRAQLLTELPTAPAESAYDDVFVVFSKITEGDEEKGFVPGYHFRILDSNRNDVGHINFRVGDTPHVSFAAGHVGYEITEKHRGNRYAAKACLALAPWIRKNSDNVLITVEPDNVASIKTIKCIGAQFIDKVNTPENDPHFLRGSRVKLRYNWKP